MDESQSKAKDLQQKINQAMFDFNKSLLNPLHKSFLNDIGVAFLDKTRATEIVEIEISKAFTSAFLQIKEIQMFNQFDTWKV